MTLQYDNKGISLALPEDNDKIQEFLELVDGGTIERISIGIRSYSDPFIDLAFLQNIKNTQNIQEISLGRCFNFEVIYRFSNVKHLNVDVENNETIDLAYFPKLEELSTSNISAYKNLSAPKIKKFLGNDDKFYPEKIEEMRGLKTLIFHPVPKGFDFHKISKLKELERISITTGAIYNLSGIENFQNLLNFDISYIRTLNNIDGISLLPKLQFVNIDSCPKLTNIDEISNIETLLVLFLENIKKCDLSFIYGMQSLKCLIINYSGAIPNIEFINGLNNLLTFVFCGTNILNGDLAPCMRLKFAHTLDKRHYNLKNEQLPHDYDYCLSAYFGKL